MASGSATIKGQQTAESFVTDDLALSGHLFGIDKFVADPLVISLGIVMDNEIPDGVHPENPRNPS